MLFPVFLSALLYSICWQHLSYTLILSFPHVLPEHHLLILAVLFTPTSFLTIAMLLTHYSSLILHLITRHIARFWPSLQTLSRGSCPCSSARHQLQLRIFNYARNPRVIIVDPLSFADHIPSIFWGCRLALYSIKIITHAHKFSATMATTKMLRYVSFCHKTIHVTALTPRGGPHHTLAYTVYLNKLIKPRCSARRRRYHSGGESLSAQRPHSPSSSPALCATLLSCTYFMKQKHFFLFLIEPLCLPSVQLLVWVCVSITVGDTETVKGLKS